MSVAQAKNLGDYMLRYREAVEPERAIVLHHGDCVGADLQAHLLAYSHGWQVEIHPGADAEGASPKRAFSENKEFRHVRAIHVPAPYMERNMDIVVSSILLLSCPGGPEKQRSGTWSTVRAAERMARMAVIFMPDGEIEQRNEDLHGHEED